MRLIEYIGRKIAEIREENRRRMDGYMAAYNKCFEGRVK